MFKGVPRMFQRTSHNRALNGCPKMPDHKTFLIICILSN